MFNSLILEVAIGLIFVYLFLSVISSTVNEWIARILSWRPKMLYEGILNLLSGGDKDQYSKALLDKIYKHPLFLGTEPSKKKDEKKDRDYSPSYIPGRSFALALMETLKGDNQPEKVLTFDEVKAAVEKINPDHPLKKALSLLMEGAEGNLDNALKNIEAWYDGAMERVTGWYKRKSQTWIFFLALGLCLALNADTFMMAKSFYSDNALKSAVVAASTKLAEKEMPTDPKEKAKWEENILKTTENLNLPLGWGCWGSQSQGTSPVPGSDQSKNISTAPGSKNPTTSIQVSGRDGLSLVTKLFGILLTALAVSLGAPFWFDLLNKVVNLRSTGKPPKGSDQAGHAQAPAQTPAQGSAPK